MIHSGANYRLCQGGIRVQLQLAGLYQASSMSLAFCSPENVPPNALILRGTNAFSVVAWVYMSEVIVGCQTGE